MKKSLMILGSFTAIALATPALAATAIVPGSANPFLAGQPDTTTCCGGDIAAAQSPVLAPVILTGGEVLSFSATGGVSYDGGAPGSPDGDNDGTNYTYRFDMTPDAGTGISGPLQANVDGLVGVFLDGSIPGGTAPAQLDFTAGQSTTGLDFASLAPGLDQIFWIGDGLTGIGMGALQQFTVPTGATRLYLGTVDGTGWSNNTGAFSVTINGAPGSVPEPATWAMMLLGFGSIGFVRRRSWATSFV